MTFDEVLAPIDRATFLHEYAGERYAVIRGRNGRFHSLFSWDDLNASLSTMRVNNDRVFLVQDTKPIARSSYVQASLNGRSENLIGSAVTQLVSAGATLVINGVDELFPGVRGIAESCEELFNIYVSANLYAGWRRDRGFDVHWDGHDTLIVQVRGRKDWKLWAPSRLHPVEGEGPEAMPRPTATPTWEGSLEDGDVLYMPRGWWHVACPRDEPSVHVTLGLRHPTGLDLLQWAVQQMKDCTAVRMDVPYWKSAQQRASWVRELRELFVERLGDESVQQHLEATAGRAKLRPIVRLPQTGLGLDRRLTDVVLLRLFQQRRLHLHRSTDAGVLWFVSHGKEWRCSAALEPALERLSHITPCTLGEMKTLVAEPVAPMLVAFVGTLVEANVVWAEFQTAENALSGVSS